jgi:hypothetical protein
MDEFPILLQLKILTRVSHILRLLTSLVSILPPSIHTCHAQIGSLPWFLYSCHLLAYHQGERHAGIGADRPMASLYGLLSLPSDKHEIAGWLFWITG